MTRPTHDPLAVTGQRPYRSRHGITRWSGPRPVDAPPSQRECPDCKRFVVTTARWANIPVAERALLAATHAPHGRYDQCRDCCPPAAPARPMRRRSEVIEAWRKTRGTRAQRVTKTAEILGMDRDACRRAIRKAEVAGQLKTRAPKRPPAFGDGELCGTDSGYHQHLKRSKTEPCDACRDAHAVSGRLASARRRIARAAALRAASSEAAA